jgi:hypothetical protein
MLAARPRSNHWRAAAIALALIGLFGSRAEAQAEWQRHARAWFGADFSLSPVGRYTRELDAFGARDRPTGGGSLTASFQWVGEGPLGIGAHAGPSLNWVSLPGIDGRVFVVDVGIDPLARLAWESFELTLRVPLGLSTGRLNWVRTSNESLLFARANNDLGLGLHLTPLLGAVVWLGDWVGIRLESGITYRHMKFDEGEKQPFPGDVEAETIRGEVTHHSLAWTISIGFVRRFNPANLPDDKGPPPPTPDYYQPSLHSPNPSTVGSRHSTLRM